MRMGNDILSRNPMWYNSALYNNMARAINALAKIDDPLGSPEVAYERTRYLYTLIPSIYDIDKPTITPIVRTPE